MFDGKEYNKCNEISRNSNDELLMKFKSIVENIVNKNGCVMNYIYDRSGILTSLNFIKKLKQQILVNHRMK